MRDAIVSTFFEHKSRQRALAVAGSWRVGHRLKDSTWQGAAALQTEASCYLVRNGMGTKVQCMGILRRGMQGSKR